MKCWKCGIDNAQQMSFCTECGSSLKKDTVDSAIKQNLAEHVLKKTASCHVCNTKLSEDTVYCHMCGSRQSVELPNKDDAGTTDDVLGGIKESETLNKCSVCGKAVQQGEEKCAACSVSSGSASTKKDVEKHEGSNDKKIVTDIEKAEPKQIEPIIAMITKMKPEETNRQEIKSEKTGTEKSEIQETKTEQEQKREQDKAINKVESKENKNKNKSNAAHEFLPPENSEENAFRKKLVKADNAKPQTNPQKEKTQNEKSFSSSTEDDKKKTDKPLEQQPTASKAAQIKPQSTKPAEKQRAKSNQAAENKSSQWKSVQVSAALPKPQMPPQINGKQSDLSFRKEGSANATAAQSSAPKMSTTFQQQHNGQQELPNRRNASVQSVSVQQAATSKRETTPQASPVAVAQRPAPASGMVNGIHQTATQSMASAMPQGSPPEKQKGKKAVFAVLVISIIVIFGAAFSMYSMIRSSNYDEAVQYMNAGQYADAYELFQKLGGYKDSDDYEAECYQFIRYDEAAGLMEVSRYEDAAKIFSELGEFKNSKQLFNICTMFHNGISFYNDGKYWNAYSTFEKLDGYGDSGDWMKKCIQNTPANGVADTGEAYATGTASIKIINSTVFDAFLIIYTADGRYWGGIYIQAGTSVTVEIKPDEYRANLAAGTTWFGVTDMFGRGQNASYQQNVAIGDQNSTSFFVLPNEAKAFTIYS